MRTTFFVLFFLSCALGLGAQPRKVAVDLHVIDVSRLDLATGKYAAQVDLSFKTGGQPIPAFEIYNGSIEGTLRDVTDEEDTAEGYRRLRGTIVIAFDPDFAAFPFDEQELDIMIAATEEKTDKLVFETEAGADAAEALGETARFPGLDLEAGQATVGQVDQSGEKDFYSTYNLPIALSRRALPAFMKVFFPLTIMLVISLLAIFILAGSISNRLTLVTGTLLGAVMFHLSATSQLPPLSYMTLADKVFLAVYLSFLTNVGLTMVMWKRNDAKNEEGVKKLYALGLWLVPAVTGAVLILLPILF